MFNNISLHRSTIWFAILLMTAISFTWSERWSSIGIILLCLHWLIDRNLPSKIISFFTLISRPHIITILLWAFFLWQLLGILWSGHRTEGWQSIEVKLSFFILPILFSTENYWNNKRLHTLLLCVGLSCCTAMFYSFLLSYQCYKPLGWFYVFQRVNFSESIMHPGYYANYVSFVFIWAILYLFDGNTQKEISKMSIIILLLILLLLILLLASKTAFLFLAVFFVYLVIHFMMRLPNLYMKFGLIAAAIIIGVFMILKVPQISGRLAEMSNGMHPAEKNVDLGNSTGSRLAAWQNEWILIKKNWLLGYGTGEANPILKKQFVENGFHRLASDNMHTHSQIFHTWLNNGILGIVLLFAIMIMSAIQFYKQKNKLAFWLTILIFINLLTDDMLEIQAGSVFFAFFLCLFLYQTDSRKYRHGYKGY